ncbi:unnamed protein product [Gadus morhua 'NCC']
MFAIVMSSPFIWYVFCERGGKRRSSVLGCLYVWGHLVVGTCVWGLLVAGTSVCVCEDISLWGRVCLFVGTSVCGDVCVWGLLVVGDACVFVWGHLCGDACVRTALWGCLDVLTSRSGDTWRSTGSPFLFLTFSSSGPWTT